MNKERRIAMKEPVSIFLDKAGRVLFVYYGRSSLSVGDWVKCKGDWHQVKSKALDVSENQELYEVVYKTYGMLGSRSLSETGGEQ